MCVCCVCVLCVCVRVCVCVCVHTVGGGRARDDAWRVQVVPGSEMKDVRAIRSQAVAAAALADAIHSDALQVRRRAAGRRRRDHRALARAHSQECSKRRRVGEK